MFYIYHRYTHETFYLAVSEHDEASVLLPRDELLHLPGLIIRDPVSIRGDFAQVVVQPGLILARQLEQIQPVDWIVLEILEYKSLVVSVEVPLCHESVVESADVVVATDKVGLGDAEAHVYEMSR